VIVLLLPRSQAFELSPFLGFQSFFCLSRRHGPEDKRLQRPSRYPLLVSASLFGVDSILIFVSSNQVHRLSIPSSDPLESWNNILRNENWKMFRARLHFLFVPSLEKQIKRD
jgi:hypothetical protein